MGLLTPQRLQNFRQNKTHLQQVWQVIFHWHLLDRMKRMCRQMFCMQYRAIRTTPEAETATSSFAKTKICIFSHSAAHKVSLAHTSQYVTTRGTGPAMSHTHPSPSLSKNSYSFLGSVYLSPTFTFRSSMLPAISNSSHATIYAILTMKPCLWIGDWASWY